MGLTDTEIRQELKRNNIGGAKGIMRGEFEPFKVTPKNYREMRAAGIFDQFPQEAVQELRKQLNNIPLSPEAGPRPSAPSFRQIEPTPTAPTTNPFLSAPAPAAPTTNPFLQGSQQGSLQVPQMQQAPARMPGPVNPALLGDNPVDVALNAQIASRQS